MSKCLFTSESVTGGHPDKLCDQIADAILDNILTRDAQARVAAECVVSTGLVLVTGQISTKTHVDIPTIVRRVIKDVGYVGEGAGGFDAETCAVLVSIDKQSPDIAGGVATALEHRASLSGEALDELGAGDQGIVFGFACDETPEFMPLPITLAHRLARMLALVRKGNTINYLRPDGKTQVTVEYDDHKPIRIDSIVVSAQHDPTIDGISDNVRIQSLIAEDLREHILKVVFENEVMNRYWNSIVKYDQNTRILINPAGRFVVGGPQADVGLTGRKIIVDTYGGYARHGGGSFSGKDPTKVDRSGAYAARHAAKNVVAAGLAARCEIQLGYAIGVARPVSVYVDTFDTGKIDDTAIAQIVKDNFDFRPAAIIKRFQLQELPKDRGGIFYQHMATYGHFGRPELKLPWEKLDQVPAIKKAAG